MLRLIFIISSFVFLSLNVANAQVVIDGPNLQIGPGMQFGAGSLRGVGLGSAKIVGNFYCYPSSNQTKILASRNVNDLHPNWKPPSFVGTSWSLKVLKVFDDQNNTFIYGNLISPKGGVVDKGVYGIDGEWICQTN